MDNKIPGSIHIAVTGHRFIPDDLDLHYAIRHVLCEILEAEKTQDVVLFSALAEGSDQLVAKTAQEFKDIKLQVPLPMAVEAYLEDFATEDGRTSFENLISTAAKVINLSSSGNHQDSYATLGNYLVNHADVLLALWNGVYNHKKGGTGEVVRAALQAGKPVYWIYCPNGKLDSKNILEGHKQIGDLEIL